MSSFAYKDKNRCQKITPQQALSEDISTYYYCPNPNCNARLLVVQAAVPYFSANLRGFPHVSGCGYANNSYSPDRYDEDSFDYDSFIQKLLEDSKTGISRGQGKRFSDANKLQTRLPIKTLHVLYFACKYHGIGEKIGNCAVSDILLDQRSIDIAPLRSSQFRIVESRGSMYYFPNTYTIKLLDHSSRNDYYIDFQDPTLFVEIKNRLYNNKGKPIVVAGNWEKRGELFYCHVVNQRQVFVVKMC